MKIKATNDSNNINHLELLKELNEDISTLPISSYRLFLITRNPKKQDRKVGGMADVKQPLSKKKRVSEKFTFSAFSVPIDDELRTHFRKLFVDKLKFRLSRENVNVSEYSPITDETNPILHYTLTGNKIAFADVVQNSLLKGTDIPEVNSLAEIVDTIWSYCIQVTNEDSSKVFSFTKLRKGKLTTDKKLGIMAKLNPFDKKSISLTALKHEDEVIEFDRDIDCIYFNESFYVFGKGHFEEILILEDEFAEVANDVVEHLEGTGLINGLEHLRSKFDNNSLLIKKLFKISRTENHRVLMTLEGLKLIKTAIERRRIALKFDTEGKICVEDEKDVDIFIKILAGYYLEEIVTQKLFGSFSKVELE